MYPISVVKNELIYLSIAAIQRYEKRSCPLEMKELGEREQVLFFFLPYKGCGTRWWIKWWWPRNDNENNFPILLLNWRLCCWQAEENIVMEPIRAWEQKNWGPQWGKTLYRFSARGWGFGSLGEKGFHSLNLMSNT